VTGPRDDQSPYLWVETTPGELSVRAGEQAVFSIAVENRSQQAQTQSIELEGLPADWVAIDFDERSRAFPREQRRGTLTISVPAGAAAERLRFSVIARAGSERSSAQCWLEVLRAEQPAAAPGIALSPPSVAVQGGGGHRERMGLSVRNVGDSETEYSVSLNGLPAGWYSLPPTVRVGAGQAAALDLWLTPPASAQASTYRFVVRLAASGAPAAVGEAAGELAVSEPEPESDVDTTAVERPASAAAAPPPPPAPSPPGPASEESAVVPPDVFLAPSTMFRFSRDHVSEQAMITIQNPSRLQERYRIDIEGLPVEWYSISGTELTLDPGESRQVPLRLGPRPGPDNPAGEYSFTIRVAPYGYSEASVEVAAALSVGGVQSFEAQVTPPQSQGRKESYTLTLRNSGTVPISFAITGSDPEQRCKIEVPPASTLEPGTDTTLAVKVGARRSRFFGSPETFDFRLHVVPEGADADPQTLDARFIHRPYFSGRVPVLALFFATLIALTALTVRLAPSPVEAFFTSTGCRIHRGPECSVAVVTVVATPTPTPTIAAETVTATPTAVPSPAAAPCTGGASGSSKVPGLAVGAFALADVRANIRSDPSTDASRVGQIQGTTDSARTVQIVAGPWCGDTFTWWRVEAQDAALPVGGTIPPSGGPTGPVTGWTVEIDAEGQPNLSLIP
jgi:uncharacterized membrane protein